RRRLRVVRAAGSRVPSAAPTGRCGSGVTRTAALRAGGRPAVVVGRPPAVRVARTASAECLVQTDTVARNALYLSTASTLQNRAASQVARGRRGTTRFSRRPVSVEIFSARDAGPR